MTGLWFFSFCLKIMRASTPTREIAAVPCLCLGRLGWLFCRPRAPVCAGGSLPGKQVHRKGPGGLGGHEINHEAAICLCGKGHQPPGLRQAERCQQVQEGDPSSLLSPGEMWFTTEPSAGLPNTSETWMYWRESSRRSMKIFGGSLL